MENIILIGVCHAIDQSSEEIYAVLANDFSEEIILDELRSADSALIIAEVGYKKEILTMNNYGYEEYLRKISKKLYESDYGPDIIPSDIRMKDIKAQRKHTQKLSLLGNWAFKQKALSSHAFDFPKSVDDVLVLARKSKSYLFLNSTPPPNILEAAKYIKKHGFEMEEYCLSLAEKYKNSYDKVLIITGAVHTIAMHIKTGLPYRIPNYEETYCNNLLNGYILYNPVLDLILNYK